MKTATARKVDPCTDDDVLDAMDELLEAAEISNPSPGTYPAPAPAPNRREVLERLCARAAHRSGETPAVRAPSSGVSSSGVRAR
jgi:hypothetical protein